MTLGAPKLAYFAGRRRIEAVMCGRLACFKRKFSIDCNFQRFADRMGMGKALNIFKM